MSWTEIQSAGEIANLACMLEVVASKPGNVHRGADFEDVGLVDFLASGVSLGYTIDACQERELGETVALSVQRTTDVTQTNTNLGIILLLVPLAKLYAKRAKAQEQSELETGFTCDAMKAMLHSATQQDFENISQAIRTANPGGLGKANEMDVHDLAGIDGAALIHQAAVGKAADSNKLENSLLKAMRLAKDRDLIADQYVSGFQLVFEHVAPMIVSKLNQFESLTQAIVFTHVSLMAEFPDSLIARKCGGEVANQSRLRAQRAIDELSFSKERFWNQVGELDFWLRSDGNRRNPGTTADLIAAGLFVGIANGSLQPPYN